MIVECGSCGTRFQLDDARVPETGIRVRCSKCKQAFFLPHPDAPSEDVVHEVAAEAVADPGFAPQPTRDLAEDSPGPADEPDVAPAEFDDDDDDEDDWEFNDDGVTVPDLREDARKAAAEDENLELDGGPLEADDRAEFGTPMDNLSDSSASLDVGTEHGFDSEVDNAVDVAVAGEPGPMQAPLAEESAAATSAIGEDLGAPEDWDFLSDHATPPPPSDNSSESRAIGKIALKAAGEELGSSGSFRALEDIVEEAPARRELDAVLGAIGWAAVLVLFAVGAVRGLMPGAFVPHVATSSPSIALGDLSVDGVRGGWVDTAGNGRVFAVTGLLGNPGSAPASAATGLAVVLRDADGQRLPSELAVAGLGITQTQVRELPGWKYAELQARAAERFANTPLRPGASRPFVATLSQVPLEARQFALEAVKAPGGE